MIELDETASSDSVELAPAWEFVTWQRPDETGSGGGGSSEQPRDESGGIELAQPWEYVTWSPVVAPPEPPATTPSEAAPPTPTVAASGGASTDPEKKDGSGI